MPMKYSDEALAALTESFEGVELKVYPDPATGGEPWTAGMGHTGPDVFPGLVVTPLMVKVWAHQDVGKAETAVNNYVKVPLTQHQFDAMVDFVFNVGVGNFLSSTLLRLVNAQDFASADLEFGKWVKAGGHVMPGLVKRRAAEAAWFATGT